MFPEYRDLIRQLKTIDLRFKCLFDEHNALDQQIANLEEHVELTHLRAEEIAELKKHKLHLKSQIYSLLLKSIQSAH
jgi:uncharacterized protein